MVVRFGPRAGMCGAVLKEGKMANTNSKPGASDADGHEPDRRDFIVVATYAMGAVGAGAASVCTSAAAATGAGDAPASGEAAILMEARSSSVASPLPTF